MQECQKIFKQLLKSIQVKLRKKVRNPGKNIFGTLGKTHATRMKKLKQLFHARTIVVQLLKSMQEQLLYNC